MRAPAASLDIVFQDTGVWMWLVHTAMSVVFAGLLFAMWLRLRRALVGWLGVVFTAHAAVGISIAMYWWGGLVSPLASALLAVMTGGAIASVTPVMMGVARELSGRPAQGFRSILPWTLGGMLYAGVAAVLILQRTDRPDVLVTTAFRPLALIAGIGPVIALVRARDVQPNLRVAGQILTMGFVANAIFAVAETIFRTSVGLSSDPSLPITATVVTNLFALLTIGIASLLATIAQGRAELQATLDQEVRLSKQEAQAARLESLGRLAAGVANDFNGLLSDANQHLAMARAHWRTEPDRALAELRGVRVAVERGTDITTGLLRLARNQESTPRRISPAARLRELLPVLERMMSHAQDLQTEITARNDLVIAPVQFDQLVLNVLLAAMESGQSGSSVQLTLCDVMSRDLSRSDWVHAPFDVFSSATWVRLTVSCEIDPLTVRTSGEVEAPATRSGAWRLAGRELGAVIGHATAQLVTEAIGGHVRVIPSTGSSVAVEVWLPAQTAVSAAQATYASALHDRTRVAESTT